MAAGTATLKPFLDRLCRHSKLTVEEQRLIMSLPHALSHIRSGYDMIGSSELSEKIYIVVAGMAGQYEQAVDGKRQTTAVFIAGDALNLGAVIQPDTGGRVCALSTCTLLEVPRTSMFNIAMSHSGVATAFWHDEVIDATILAQRLFSVSRRAAKSRIAHLLCELATRYQAPTVAGEKVFQLPLNQYQLAELTGLTAIHVNRMLRELEAEKLSAVRNGVATIRDWARLTKIANFDPTYLRGSCRSDDPPSTRDSAATAARAIVASDLRR